MKEKTIYVFAMFLCLIGMFGCGKNANSEVNKVNDSNKKVCGIVRNIDDNIINIQLCGNIFKGVNGKCYLEVNNEYKNIKQNDSVLIHYGKELEFEKIEDGKYKIKNIIVTDIEKYNNDFKFRAEIFIACNLVDENGEEYQVDDFRNGCIYFLKAADDEPELNFEVVYTGKEKLDVDIHKEVVVVYNIDDMSIVSVTQK